MEFTIALKPNIGKGQSELRQDGVYVQFGDRVWTSEYFKTSKCWYNMMRVVDNETLFVLGCVSKPFWDAKSPHRHISFIKNSRNLKDDCDHSNPIDYDSDDWCNNDVKGCRCFTYHQDICQASDDKSCTCSLFGMGGDDVNTKEGGQDLYKYLGITDPSNPIQTAQEVLKLSKEFIVSLKPQCLCVWDLRTPIDDPDDEESQEESSDTSSSDSEEESSECWLSDNEEEDQEECKSLTGGEIQEMVVKYLDGINIFKNRYSILLRLTYMHRYWEKCSECGKKGCFRYLQEQYPKYKEELREKVKNNSEEDELEENLKEFDEMFVPDEEESGFVCKKITRSDRANFFRSKLVINANHRDTIKKYLDDWETKGNRASCPKCNQANCRWSLEKHLSKYHDAFCDVCGSDGLDSLIYGNRYKCQECADYDLCEVCFAEGQHCHHILTRLESRYDCDTDTQVGWAQSSQCNDDFTLYYQDNPLILFDYGSPGRVELAFEDEFASHCPFMNPATTKCHNFPLYFVPTDLNEEEGVWKKRYENWFQNWKQNKEKTQKRKIKKKKVKRKKKKAEKTN